MTARKNKSQTKSQATSKFFGSNMFIDSDETSFLIQIVNRLFIILESRFTHTHIYSYMNRNESVEICLNDIFWLRTMPMLFEMCSTTNIRLKRPNSYSKLLEITIFLKQYLIFHSECHEISGKLHPFKILMISDWKVCSKIVNVCSSLPMYWMDGIPIDEWRWSQPNPIWRTLFTLELTEWQVTVCINQSENFARVLFSNNS